MAIVPGRYGRFGIRARPPGNARFLALGAMDLESNQRIMASAQAALAKPFVGLTSDGDVTPGLFALRQSGVSTQPIVDAANAFLASFAPASGSQLSFPIDANEWRMGEQHAPYRTPRRHVRADGRRGA
jgi:hypothetical protein